MPLSILIWLPLASALLGAFAAAARWAPRALLAGSLAAARCSRSILLAGFDTGKAGLQYVTDETVDLLARDPLQARPRRAQPVPRRADGDRCFFAAVLVSPNFREWERPRLFYFQLGLAETAVLGAFLAQDLILFVVFFDLMLIPFYFLIGVWGGRQPGARRRRSSSSTRWSARCSCSSARSPPACSPPSDGSRSPSRCQTSSARPLEQGSQDWIFLCFAAAFLVKMPAFPLHGWMPDGYRAMPIAGAGRVLGRALEGRRLRLPAHRAAALPATRRCTSRTLMLLIALASILYGSAMAFTVDRRAPGRRLLVGRPARVHHARRSSPCTPQGAQGALLQMVNHGLVGGAVLFIDRAAGRARRRLRGHPRHGRHRVARAGARRAVPDRRLRDAGDAGLVELRRRVPDPVRRLPGEDRRSRSSRSAAWSLASVYMLRAFIRTMHNRVGTRRGVA